jgi:spore coat protein A, manganese oxidase
VSFSLTRRDFLQATLLAAHNHQAAVPVKTAPPLVDVSKLAKFVDSLPMPPIAQAVGFRKKIPFYRIPMRPVLAKAHRDLPATIFW